MEQDIFNFLLVSFSHLHLLLYVLAFGAAFLETAIGVGIFLPGSSFLLLLGALSSQGEWRVEEILFFAFLGALLGDNLNYFLGRHFGKKWLEKGVWFLAPEHFSLAQDFFQRHGAKSVFLGRFVPTLKEIIPFLAGLSKMKKGSFFVWNFLGAIGWSLEWVLTGYFFAQSLSLARWWLGRASLAVGVFFLFLLLFYFLKIFFLRKGPMILALFSSLKQALKKSRPVKWLERRYPRLFFFLKKRLVIEKFFGLPFTLLSLFFVYLLLLFLDLVWEMVVSQSVVYWDNLALEFLLKYRFSFLVKVFYGITLLGKWYLVGVFLAGILLFLWLKKKYWLVWSFGATVLGAAGTTGLTKIIFHRPRPEASVYLEKTFSFPSGHATIAVAFYGFLGYILIRLSSDWRRKVNAFFGALLVIVLIGFSRLYLGVHYLSDVWGGYLIGLMWLIIGITLSEWLKNYYSKKTERR